MSACWKHHEHSLRVLEGTIENDAWFAYVCALDVGDDWRDEKVWYKANPGLGVTIPLKYLREQVAEAVGMPSKENLVRRLNFCEWTEQATRWIDMDIWDRGNVPAWPGARARCFGGLDLASTRDVSAFVKLFGPGDDGFYDAVCRFWVPEEGIRERSLKDRVPYDVWASQGFVTATPGNVTDFDFIERDVLEDAQVLSIQEIAYDRWNASQLVTHLMDKLGGGGTKMVPFGQGFESMAGPTRELERILLAGKLRHGGNPVLRWMASNVAVRQDPAGNTKIDRLRSSEKVDGMVALVMAAGRSILHKPAPRPRISFLGDQDDRRQP
jgi:phage terminase large subunit-like protein